MSIIARAVALANEVSAITDDHYVAVIGSDGISFAILDHRGLGPVVEDLTEEDVIADALEVLDLGDAVAADPEAYTPETRAAHGVETAEERAAREAQEDAIAEVEVALEAFAEQHAAEDRERRAEVGSWFGHEDDYEPIF